MSVRHSVRRADPPSLPLVCAFAASSFFSLVKYNALAAEGSPMHMPDSAEIGAAFVTLSPAVLGHLAYSGLED